MAGLIEQGRPAREEGLALSTPRGEEQGRGEPAMPVTARTPGTGQHPTKRDEDKDPPLEFETQAPHDHAIPGMWNSGGCSGYCVKLPRIEDIIHPSAFGTLFERKVLHDMEHAVQMEAGK